MAVDATVNVDVATPTADRGERTGAALVDLAIATFLFVFGVAAGAILIAVGGPAW
jgi:hypothetical protein